jgi:hypothetical protein
MKKETLKNIFNFLEENEGHRTPFMWKLMNNEPLTDEELFVEGGLSLWGTDITSLPKGLDVGGNLILTGLNLTSLPEGLKVRGSLLLTNSEIASLPKGLKVWGYIDLRDTKLKGYTDVQLREMIKPGFIRKKILKK